MKTDQPLRLLSKTAAAAELGIGKEKLQKIIDTDQINITIIDGKIKIAVRDLISYLDKVSGTKSELSAKLSQPDKYELRLFNTSSNKPKKSRIDTDSIFNNIFKEVA